MRARFHRLRHLSNDEVGATATEYAVMLAFVIAIMTVVIGAVGNAVASKWSNNAAQVAGTNG